MHFKFQVNLSRYFFSYRRKSEIAERRVEHQKLNKSIWKVLFGKFLVLNLIHLNKQIRIARENMYKKNTSIHYWYEMCGWRGGGKDYLLRRLFRTVIRLSISLGYYLYYTMDILLKELLNISRFFASVVNIFIYR